MNEIFTRTSVRNFTEKMPSDDQIELVLKAAMQAPSAGNQRSWEFYVVRDRTALTLPTAAARKMRRLRSWSARAKAA